MNLVSCSKETINELTNEIKLLQKYRNRLSIVNEGSKAICEGIYTKMRNAYKINPQSGAYGNLITDLPKLYGQLKLIAYTETAKKYMTNGLTMIRLVCSRRDSTARRMVFDDPKRISEIAIHRTSKKYKKIGSGVIYYNNPQELMVQLELLGGSILAGNDGVID